MGKIYVNQTALRLIARTGITLEDASVVKIKYKKPNGNTGEWTASILNSDEGTIYFDITDSDSLDVVGEWKFWSWVKFIDGRVAPGEVYTKYVYNEGQS